MLCGVLNSIMGSQLLSKKGLRYTMEAIVAVYEDWGIGCCGTQPVALSVDRNFFREMTRGAMVIVGRRTVADFPGQKPLPGRVNVVLTRQGKEIPGFTVCGSPEEAVELAKTAQKAMVIGGGSIYRQMLPFCDSALVTKVYCNPGSDTYFPNLDKLPTWEVESTSETYEENGLTYQFINYVNTKI